MKKHIMILLLSLLLPLAACAHKTATLDDNITNKSTEELLFDYRTTLNTLREEPFAKETARELDMAQIWMERAERLLDAKKPDQAQIDLLLLAVEGQLIQIRSTHARREAEEELERTRGSYETRAGVIERARQRNDKALERSPIQGKEDSP